MQPQFRPPPVQQDIRNVENATDRRVQQSLDQGSSLESRLPNELQTNQARGILDWAEKARGARMGDYGYDQQIDRIADMARRALQTGDSSLLQQAQGGALVLVFGVMAQHQALQSGSAEGKALSDSLHRGLGLIGTEGGLERAGAGVAGAKNYLDNRDVYNAAGNADAKKSVLATVDRLTDPSVRMSVEEVNSAFQGIQHTLTVATARVSESRAIQSASGMLAVLMNSELARDKMKDQLDKLLDDLANTLAKLSDPKKSKEEKEKEAAEVERKAEKALTSVLEHALTEAGAPPELVAAVKGAGKMLESRTAAIREKGRQLLQLGITFVRNKELLLKDKALLNKLVATAKLVAGNHPEKKILEALASFEKDLGKALDALSKAASKKAKALESLGASLQKLMKGVEETGSKPLREAASKLLQSIQQKLKSGENITTEYLRGVHQTIQYLKSSLAGLLRLPANEKQEREESAGLVANALNSAVKDPKSEITKLLQFIAGEHMLAIDPEYKGLLAKLGDSLSKGKATVEEAKAQLVSRFLKEADSAESVLRKASPALADAFASIFKPLREGKSDLGLLAKASQALGIFSFIKNRVLPQKNEELRNGSLKIAGKAVSALQNGNMEGMLKNLEFANQLVSAPEGEALEALRQYDAALVKQKELERDELAFERKALLDALPGLPGALQAKAEKMLGQIDQALKGQGETVPLIIRAREFRKMGEMLQKTANFEAKKALEELFSLALDRLEAGDSAQYRALMFAASEIMANQGFDAESAQYRKDIMQQVSGMKDSAKAEEAIGKLNEVIKQTLSKRLAKANVPEESKQQIAQIIANGDLQSLKVALDIVKSMNDFLNSQAGMRLPREKRDAASGIYRRSLSALAEGLDPSIAGAQKFLAEKYLASNDSAQAADIDALSERIEDEPQAAMPDVQTFIQINDQSVLAVKKAKELPKNSPLAAPLESISKELEKVRGKIARGEDLADPEKYKKQVREMLKDDAVKAQIESLAKEIKAANEGMADEEAMEAAIEEAAKSAAIVAERERIKGLMGLQEMILQAGAKPKPELAELFERAGKAFIGGELEKGALFMEAARAGMANPANIAKIAEIAKACDGGKLPLDSGMFIFGLNAERAGLEGKIQNSGQLANAKAYFDLASLAAEKGDLAGAQEIRQMALAYAALAAAKESSLDKDSKKQRDEAMTSIEKYLGDYKKGGKISEMKPEEAKSPVAAAVLSQKPLKEAMGGEFAKLQEDSAKFSKIAFIASHASDFDSLLGKGADEQWEREKKRLMQLSEQYRKAGRGALADYYAQKADEVDRGFATDAIAKGKEVLAKAASELERAEKLTDEAKSLAAQAKEARDAGKNEEAAKLEEKAQAAYGEAMAARQNSDKLRIAAGALSDGLSDLDTSVRRVNTIHRERGRFQLNIGIKTALAIGLGHDADRLGDRKEGPLTPEREAELFEQAAGEIQAGKQAVKVQQDIMRTRDAGIAAAQSLQEANLKKALELIGKLADLNPATAQAQKDEAKKLAEDKDFDKLQKYYFGLAYSNGVKVNYTDHDGENKTAFDPLVNEKKYQQVLGLYWGENFAGASALSRQARFDIESGGQIASLNIDYVRLSRQLKSVVPKHDKNTHFPVGKGGFADPRSELLIKQMIAHLPEDKREAYYEKLGKITRGRDGDVLREMLFNELNGQFPGSYGNDSMADKIVNGDLIYFNHDELVGLVVSARGLAAKGDIAGAEFSLQGAQDIAYTKIGMQEADNDRVSFDYAEYDYTMRAYRTKDYYPKEPEPLDESASGKDKKRNLDERLAAVRAKHLLEPAVDELKGRLEGRAKHNGAASKMALKSRDSIERTAGKLNLTEDSMLALMAKIPETKDPKVQEIKKMLLEARDASGTPAYEEKVRKLWGHVLTNSPEMLFSAVQRASGDPQFGDEQIVQLLALSSGLIARKSNMQWDTEIEPYVAKRLQTGIALQNRAEYTQDEDDKRKLYNLAREATGLAKSLARDGYGWMDQPERVKKMQENDYDLNFQAFKLIFAKSDLNLEFQKTWNAEDYARKKTELQLWLSGFRVGEDGTLERFQMTPGEYRRISEAYAQFTYIENDILMKAGVGVWESDEQQYLARVGSRAYDFHRSAEVIVNNKGGRFLSEVIKESEDIYNEGMPFQEVNGKLWDPDYKTTYWTKTKQDWQAAADFGKGVLKIGFYGVMFALSPVTGGATGYIAGGMAATEGFIGAAEYYEACGGDFSGMSGEEQAFMIFQVGMAVGAAAAPVVGELAQARNVARMAQMGMEAEAALAPTAIELTSVWLGRTLVAGGLVQSGISIYQLSEMAAAGQIPGWFAIAQGITEGIQSGVQPGLHAMRGMKMGKGGLPVYRNKALQIGEMILFGTPLESRARYRAAYEDGLYRAAVEKEYASLSPEDRKAFSEYIKERNISSSEAQLDLLVKYQKVREARPDTSFGSFGKRVDFDAADRPVREQYENFAKEETKKGTPIADMMRMARELEAQANGMPPDRRPEAVDMLRKSAALEREAQRRQDQLEAGLKSEMLGNLKMGMVGEHPMLIHGRYEDAKAYGPKYAQAAAELAAGADQVVRGARTREEAVANIVSNLKKKGIGADAGQIGAALDSILNNPGFIKATEGALPVSGSLRSAAEIARSRNIQLEIALDGAANINGLEAPVMMDRRESFRVTESLGLHDEAKLANFARNVVLGDKYALSRLALLPPEVRAYIEVLVHDNAFRTAAMAEDKVFDRHWQRVRSGKALIENAAKEIRKLMPPKPDEVIAKISSASSPDQLASGMEMFSRLHPADQSEVVKGLHAAGKAQEAALLNEFGTLRGRAGEELEIAFGLEPGSLAKIYMDSIARPPGQMHYPSPLLHARKELCDRLGISTALHSDNDLFGILIGGKLANIVKENFPDSAQIEIKWLGESATGAYMVKVTDSAGVKHVNYVKKVNMTPDRIGADNFQISGVPAADAVTHDAAGKPLQYMGADGNMHDYGISMDLKKSRTVLNLGGESIMLSASVAVPLNEMGGSPELMNIFINHPDAFWQEYGFLMAGQYAAGSIDGHDRNVFAMLMDVDDPTPGKIAALKSAGFHVLTPDASGKVKVFRLGRIDTDDAAGSYWATGTRGNFNFDNLARWIGGHHVLPPTFNTLNRLWNEYHYALDPNHMPVYVHDTITAGFGANGSGPVFRGMQRWFDMVGMNPEYRARMMKSFEGNSGERTGVSSFHLSQAEKDMLAQNGIAFKQNFQIPFNGEPHMPIYHADARGKISARYETVDIQGWDASYHSIFPHNTTVYAVEVPANMALPQSVSAFFTSDGRRIAVYHERQFVPPGLVPVEVTRHYNTLRAEPGFGQLVHTQVQEVGAAHVLDFILGGGPHWMGERFKELQNWSMHSIPAASVNIGGNAPTNPNPGP
ncbi:MAG: hypothetical protein AB1324_02240 [Candidatus Micrarchaeota archaeon]